VRHGSRTVGILVLALTFGGGVSAQVSHGVDVQIEVAGLRSAKGQILACLVSNAKAFPDCSKDAHARKLAVPVRPASQGPTVIDFGPVPSGTYAVALVHDENGNGRMDKQLFMPAEGYGFSRDAPVRMGPPSFSAAAFQVEGQAVRHTVKMRYMF
jgi:uncharacterized protein (DUF2141 family)